MSLLVHVDLAAHVHRNGKIIATLLIEQTENGFVVLREHDRSVVVTGKELSEVMARAEAYLDGYATGYDLAISEGKADGISGSRGAAPVEGQRGDRDDGQGAGKGDRSRGRGHHGGSCKGGPRHLPEYGQGTL